MKLEIFLPDNTLAIEGGREVCNLLNSMCHVAEDWALATGAPVLIKRDGALQVLARPHRKQFSSAV